MSDEEYTTIDQLIAALESKRRKHGGDAVVMVDGFDPCEVTVEDNYDPEFYFPAKVLINC